MLLMCRTHYPTFKCCPFTSSLNFEDETENDFITHFTVNRKWVRVPVTIITIIIITFVDNSSIPVPGPGQNGNSRSVYKIGVCWDWYNGSMV